MGEDFDAARERVRGVRGRAPGASSSSTATIPRIATGAATLALELTDAVAAGDLPAPVVVSVPVGNGALINGVGSWLRADAARLPGRRHPGRGCRGDDPAASQAGRPIDTDAAATYADGIASRVAIPRAVELMPGRVDEMRLVTEAALHETQAELTDALGITVEGAAAASWAGLLAGERPAGPAVVIVTGSNI